MAYLGLSRRALIDIVQIETYSVEKWGRKVADKYLGHIQTGLDLIRENPKILKAKPGVSDSLCFYRVREHFLVCALFEESVFVLTVKHGAMDLPARIGELEPQILQEAEILYRAYQRKLRSEQ